MTREEAILFAWRLQKSEEKHPYYDRVVKLAEKYMIYITGEEIDRLLIQFVQREDATMFKQRVELTAATTPAIANSLMKPYYKVGRNDKVKVRHDYKDPAKNGYITQMLQGFYGAKRKKSKGLNYWLKTRYVDLVFQDPNSFVVTAWDQVALTEIPQPHPMEISAKEAYNFEIVNEELNWLFACKEIFYTEVDNTADALATAGTPTPVKTKKIPGKKWMLFHKGFTVVIRTVSKEGLAAEGYVMQNNDSLSEVNGTFYLESVYETKLDFVPAFRVGFSPDLYTQNNTCVSPMHPAMAFFKKSLKTVSELDLSMTLHAFPQKFQYVQKCMGESKVKTCHNGYANGTSEKCGACEGKGYKLHTTAQDAVLLPMPESNEEMLPLENLMVYKSPPIELIKFQDEYTKGLKVEAHLAVFNSQIFVNPTYAKTATEVDDNMQSVYDTLEPFTEKVSEIYKEQVYINAHLAAVADPDNNEYENVHQYPGDLKLKTTTILLHELKLVNDSGAPSFMRDSIGNDLAQIIYVGDDLGLLKYNVKHKFFPFNGKNPDEIAMLMASQYVSEQTKILYSNYEAIFKDIEMETPEFWMMTSTSKQWDTIQAKVEEYMDELEPDAPIIQFGNAPDPGTGNDPDPGDDPGQGDGNPGEGE